MLWLSTILVFYPFNYYNSGEYNNQNFFIIDQRYPLKKLTKVKIHGNMKVYIGVGVIGAQRDVWFSHYDGLGANPRAYLYFEQLKGCFLCDQNKKALLQAP